MRSKAPFQLLCMREALIWRTEELARTACDALERDDFAAAAHIARANLLSFHRRSLPWAAPRQLQSRSTHFECPNLRSALIDRDRG